MASACSPTTMSAAKRIRSVSPSGGSLSAKSSPKRAKLPNDGLSILSWNIENPAPYLSIAPAAGNIGKYFTKKSTPSASPSKAKAPGSSARESTLRDIFAAHGYPQICCLQEVRAFSKDKDMIRSLRLSANPTALEDSSDSDEEAAAETKDGGPRYTAHFSLCKAKGGGKRFGVATYVSSEFKHQYTAREVDWDAEGRLVIMEVPSINLAIVNVYALNGSDFPWKDPLTGIAKGTRNERKREFNRLLTGECRTIQDKGYRIIAIGDWNITRTEQDCYPHLRTQEPHALARKEFNEIFMPTLGVVDMYRELYPNGKAYSVSRFAGDPSRPMLNSSKWFSPGNGYRVDYALVSRAILPAVTCMEYRMDEKWRYRSDHAPMMLAIEQTASLQ